MAKALKDILPDADVLGPRMPFSWHSLQSLDEITTYVLGRVDSRWDEHYENVFFIGHSLGGIIARKVYVVVNGPIPDVQFDPKLPVPEAKPWAQCVKRIILLAGTNRGWALSHHLSLKWTLILTPVSWILSVWGLLNHRLALVFQFRRGAPFLTQLRLEWLALRKQAKERQTNSSEKGILTVQLLGSIDNIVSPEDIVDLVSGRDFVYLDLPFTDHLNVVEMDPTRPKERDRAEMLRKALLDSPDSLKKDSVQISDLPPRNEREKVRHVIFVVHGIRDAGYWTQKIARRVIKLGGGSDPSFQYRMVTAELRLFPNGAVSNRIQAPRESGMADGPIR